ncbi:MAG: hypothetical protein KDJ75_09180 [Alphaproteobacteria bacterium]|nr:hypothetical protein [Alphaproteobacteria bacterium]
MRIFQILGVRRVLLLLSLIAANALFAGLLYVYLQPQLVKKERELRSMRGQITNVRTDINRMQVEFEQLEEQRAEFEALRSHGFFNDQQRREAEIVFQRIQDKSRVISAVATVRAGVVEDSKEAQKSDHKILKSPVEVKLEAMDDTDIMRYLYLIRTFFPGHITIEDVKMGRDAEITGTVLRSIASGGRPALVHAQIKASWRTMIPGDSVISSEQRQR